MRACEASLTRMGTGYIDVYMLHWPDPATPMEETLRALDDLVRQGKVRYIACSNLKAGEVVDAVATAKAHGLNAFIAAQNEYSLLVRSVETDLVPALKGQGIGLAALFPARKRPAHRQVQAGTRLCFDVTDIHGEYARLQGMGVQFTCPPQSLGTVLATYGRDPDGNIFELQEILDPVSLGSPFPIAAG